MHDFPRIVIAGIQALPVIIGQGAANAIAQRGHPRVELALGLVGVHRAPVADRRQRRIVLGLRCRDRLHGVGRVFSVDVFIHQAGDVRGARVRLALVERISVADLRTGKRSPSPGAVRDCGPAARAADGDMPSARPAEVQRIAAILVYRIVALGMHRRAPSAGRGKRGGSGVLASLKRARGGLKALARAAAMVE